MSSWIDCDGRYVTRYRLVRKGLELWARPGDWKPAHPDDEFGSWQDAAQWLDAGQPGEEAAVLRRRLAALEELGFEVVSLSLEDVHDGVVLNDDDSVWIFSGEHRAYWRPKGSGYTTHRVAAWQLTFKQAYARTHHCGPEKMICFRYLRSEVGC